MNKTLKLTCILFMAFMPFILKSQEAKKFFPEKDLMTVGIYYYPEHWNPDQWERDIKQISSMGFEFIHLAEFAWVQMEPEEGKYNFDWLDRVIGFAAKYNLKVIMCTPSATPPAWLGIKYPEIFVMNSNYQRAEHGTRANGSFANKIFCQYVDKINTEMAKRFGKNSNVIGWQIDNEPESKSDFSPSA